jgi:glycosyltransferase involved in cell wall biosynthesis
MNILYHHRTQGGGAEGVHIREVVGALRALGHNVGVVSPPGVDPMIPPASHGSKDSKKVPSLKKRIIQALPQVIFEALEIGYNIYAARKLKQILSSTPKIDLIYERYAFFCQAGVRIARKFGIPLILEVNEISGIKRQRAQSLVGLCRRFEQETFAQAQAIIVVSEFLKQQLIERGVVSEKIQVIPNAVNPDDFDMNLDTATLKQRYNLLGKTVITFVGMFSHWDRLDQLIEGFAQIYQQAPETHLMVVGEGIQRPDLEQQAERLNVRAHITFSGEVHRKDIPRYIGASDICVLYGSNPFGSPIALFEYMIMGKAVVVPGYEPIAAIVAHNQNGKLFVPDNLSQFVSEVIHLVQSSDERRKLGQNAREKILRSHLWKNNAQAVLEIYARIQGQKIKGIQR